MKSEVNILIIGSGVIGLSTGVKLLENGYHNVTIVTKSLSKSCSQVAGALFEPAFCTIDNEIQRMVDISFDEFELLRKKFPSNETGIILRKGYSLTKNFLEIPIWMTNKFQPKYINQSNDKNDILKKSLHNLYDYGIEFTSPCIDSPIFLEFLLKRFLNLNGKLLIKELKPLKEETFLKKFDLIVNCCGSGAVDLCPNDKEMTPKKGHVLIMKSNINEFHCQEDFDIDDPEIIPYVIPRLNNTIIVGGMSKYSLNLEINKDDQERIIKKAASNLFPEIQNGQIISSAVGLRPVRSKVRLELEIINDSKVIHNYGHGGAGVTLSLGSAQMILEKINQILKKSKL
eukprot:gene4811-8397_t